MSVEQLTHGTSVYVSATHRFGTDALLLAEFSSIYRMHSVADFGTGCGILALLLHDAGHRGQCYAIDIDPDAITLASQGVQASNATHITPLCTDATQWRAPKVLDAIVCNPPYFTAGQASPDPARARARHEQTCTIQTICQSAGKNLKTGGKLYLCNRPDRLADTICAMRDARIEPKRLQMVAENETREPWLFLIEGQKNRAVGMRVEPPRLLRQACTTF